MSRKITVIAKSIVARVAAANVVPSMLAQEHSQKTEEPLENHLGKLLKKMLEWNKQLE